MICLTKAKKFATEFATLKGSFPESTYPKISPIIENTIGSMS